MKSKAFIGLILSMIFAEGACRAEKISASELVGKSREEVSLIYPGTNDVISPWRKWKEVSLFMPDGIIEGISLQPFKPLAYHDMVELVMTDFDCDLRGSRMSNIGRSGLKYNSFTNGYSQVTIVFKSFNGDLLATDVHIEFDIPAHQ